MIVENLSKVIVLAHYNENLDWLKNLEVPYVLVTKSLKDHKNYLPVNKGHEALCYFKYIMENYHTLPNEIGFFHAHDKSHHQMHTNSFIIDNFIWGKFPYINVNRDDWYNDLYPESTRHTDVISFYWIAHFWSLIGYRFLGMLPEKIKHVTSAQFIVNRNSILARPLEFYQCCYDWLIETPLESAISARVFEYIWHIIMGAGTFEPRYEQKDFLKCVDIEQRNYLIPKELRTW